MDYDGGFILQKNVNWSLLKEGFTINVAAFEMFQTWNPSILVHGTKRPIKIRVGDMYYDAMLVNQDFKKDVYGGHRDVLQVRYSPNSELAKALRMIFHNSYTYFDTQRQFVGKSKKQIALPDDLHEYIKLYFTSVPDVLGIECYTTEDYQKLASTLGAIPEEVYESTDDDKFFMKDGNASIEERERLVKYRKIDRSIIEILKKYYDYCDEISGEKIGSEYGDSVVEAHHIDYFTRSQNNDSTNIIIISPNYHRIIHRNNPLFNRKKFQFEFANGEVLRLKLYKHLEVG